ncbi:uncharacterized protein [Palaemon carinicauda]|uniref:uncharacterized protein n=1 Tax=Palaemon carinicauda TaxID=392227 RepID=UPI0035B6216E
MRLAGMKSDPTGHRYWAFLEIRPAPLRECNYLGIISMLLLFCPLALSTSSIFPQLSRTSSGRNYLGLVPMLLSLSLSLIHIIILSIALPDVTICVPFLTSSQRVSHYILLSFKRQRLQHLVLDGKHSKRRNVRTGVLQALIAVTAIFCTASAAPQVYQARGVHHPTAQESGELSKALAASANILPELSTVLKKIYDNQGSAAFSSDPKAIGSIVSAFLPLSEQSLTLRETLTGQPSKEDQEKLKLVGRIMPVVSNFLDDLRALGGNRRSSSVAQRGEPTGELQLDTRAPNDGMVEAVLELLPEVSQIFRQINSDPARSNPNDPDFVYRVIMAFMPLSKKVLEATAKSEGRAVNQEELQRLNAVDSIMPVVIKFMSSMRGVSASDSQNTAVEGQAVLNSRFDSPKPATYKEPAFPQDSSKPVSASSYNPATSHAFPAPAPSVVSGVQPLNLPSRFETPAPVTFKQPAFPVQTFSTGLTSSGAKPASPQQPGSSTSLRTSQAAVAPQVTYTVSSTPLRSPSYPELTQVALPVHQAFIPTVPDNLSGYPYHYSFASVYGH